MFDCRQEERTFWRTMNPARLQALFTAYFTPKHRAAAQKDKPKPQEQRSLAAFFLGGG